MEGLVGVMIERAPKITWFAVDLNPLVHGLPCDVTFLFSKQPDLKIVRHGHRKMRDGQTVILGHEFVGTVEQAGSQAGDYRVWVRTRDWVAPWDAPGSTGGCTGSS